MKPKLLASPFIAACLAILFNTGAFAQQAPFDEGMQNFQAKRYNAASQNFQLAVSKTPGDQQAHLYLGFCLHELKEYDSAKDEYEIAYRLNPFSHFGEAARQAILTVSYDKQKQAHPTDDPSIYRQAVNEINRQNTDNQARWRTWGTSEAGFQRYLGGIEAFNAMQNAQWGSTYFVGRHRYRGSAFVGDAQMQANYLQTDSQSRANRYLQDAAHAAAETQISANTLKQLLSEAPKPGEPHLRALGTNLYVRNYSDFDDVPPQDPVLEMHAQAKTFADLPQEMHAVQTKLADFQK